ncbi:sigma-70 family RNA polymerase sigma factor [Rheinheimera riviphila]|uniref:Sigma-70 family RNA polymerase sigma factor n=1 Tax=Rheinheimera riviphila TaxID=1834037 RepID=A0A437R1H5_9GAMM|nr:sigma-70 family RNA polymerase sigma factor [Rheinheimera riviphila]RVU40582.1 sigma-70 family RNA polymerase sigma factor [Rheinheimera riviphila]
MGWKQISGRLGLTKADSQQWMTDYQQTGDQVLLAKLFTLHADALYFFLLRQSNAELAADISQQSWLKLLEQRDQFQGGCSFKTWLFTLARNALLDEFRQQQRWGLTEITEITETTLFPATDANPAEQQLAAQQQQQQLDLAIQQLPLLQQEALLLQLEGFSLAEIALIANSNAETVKSRLRHARTMLASLMEEKP